MCEQTEIDYLDGEVVWVKLGSCWWPGEVVDSAKLPPDVLPSFRKPPIAVVKFFQEDTFEYVKNINGIYKYNCSRKNEFIKKGLDMYRAKHGHMEKFPEDIIRAEAATDGDIDILREDQFQESKKESYAGLFGDSVKKTPVLGKRGRSTKLKTPDTPTTSRSIRNINKGNSDYKVHILVQSSKSEEQSSESLGSSINQSDKEETPVVETPKPSPSAFSTPTISSSGVYSCHACPFTTTRLNVIIFHNKTHSVTFTPYTPSPVRIKPKVAKTTPKKQANKTPKPRRPKEKKNEIKKAVATKRTAEEKALDVQNKKVKTDEEIKSSLLADWDDMEDESSEESTINAPSGSPEIPVPCEAPAEPTAAELPPCNSPKDVSVEENNSSTELNKNEEKTESPSDSRFEFCEDEDWPLEKDEGRKIPRVKNASKGKNDKKSLDEDEVAREVAELLDKTTLPELPSVPEPLKEEENFPQPSIVKSPDKLTDTIDKSVSEGTPTRTIFKTKTFFRSRHSRSQDAIGKYVAEQLNAAEKLDTLDSDINGSDSLALSESRESPPMEQVKVAKLAPKIQLKKMKAEAAQLKEKTNHDDTLCIYPPKKQDLFGKSSNSPETKGHEITNVNKADTIQNAEDSESKLDIELDKEDICANNRNNDVVNEESATTVASPKKPATTIMKPIHTYGKNEIIEKQIMNETTASAVDALLSVSRDADRVSNVISNDPPENLFEDDTKTDSHVLASKETTNGPDVSLNNNLTYTISLEHPIIDQHQKCNDKTGETLKVNIDSINMNNFSQDDDSVYNIKENENANIGSANSRNEIKTKNDVVAHEGQGDIIASQENIEFGQSNCVDPSVQDDSLVENDNHISVDNDLLQPDHKPSESDLQIAETLLNLPSTAIQNNVVDEEIYDTESQNIETEQVTGEDSLVFHTGDVIESQLDNEIQTTIVEEEVIDEEEKLSTIRYETEQEKDDNLNAAKSLVQMSVALDHNNASNTEKNSNNENNNVDTVKHLKNNMVTDHLTLEDSHTNPRTSFISKPEDIILTKGSKVQKTSKLLQILEEPAKLATKSSKPVIIHSNEKILNFDVNKTHLKTVQPSKQKIIIRRNANNLINNYKDNMQEKIILSRTNKPTSDGNSVPTYTIQASPSASSDKTFIIQQKVRNVAKTPSNMQKLKQQTSLINISAEPKPVQKVMDNTLFDINSLPVVLSEDILTPENIEQMPIVMTEGNLISNQQKTAKSKQKPTEIEKLPTTNNLTNKKEMKTLLINPVAESSKTATPNILSKSSKLKNTKQMLVIDKITGKQKIIVTKGDGPSKEPKTILPKQAPLQPTKTEKLIILPTTSTARPARTQKIVIDPQTGKAHVLLEKNSETAVSTAAEMKPMSAKIIPSPSEAGPSGGTVMIITNAQGTQSKIVLTPEHEKLLFPKKQQPNMTQIKALTQAVAKAVPQKPPSLSPQPPKMPTKIVAKQKSAIITSKGQLIIGGRVTATAKPSVAPITEIRPGLTKRIITSEPKLATISQKPAEPLIFLQQKSGAVMQLTTAQFEHLQRTGQIIQKSSAQPAVQDNKIVLQKTITIPTKEPVVHINQKQKSKVLRQVSEIVVPAKKQRKHDITIAPVPSIVTVPALAPISNTHHQTMISNAPQTSTTNAPYHEMDNFEELLPSTAIARQPEPVVPITPEPEPSTASPAQLSDGQLLAVPGEHFGGPPGSFYLCVKDNGTLTPIDNRPLILENNELVPMAIEPVSVLAQQPERRDILEAALANSDVFQAEMPRDEAPDFRDLNANVSVNCRVSETSTTLNQPIMTPVEVPSKGENEPIPSNIDAGLAVIGVTPRSIPTTLELPITVTDPRIAPKTTDPLSNANYAPNLLPSPTTELAYVPTEEAHILTGPISMPLLTEEDDCVGKSMPILTDEGNERTVSSVDSPSSTEVRESEIEESGNWSRRLLTPGSDSSESSAEIPLQPTIQLSADEMNQNG